MQKVDAALKLMRHGEALSGVLEALAYHNIYLKKFAQVEEMIFILRDRNKFLLSDEYIYDVKAEQVTLNGEKV